MGIDEVFLMMTPSMGHRWTIDDPSMAIEIFSQKKSFDLAMFKSSTKVSPFKFFSLFKFCLEFRGCPIISFGNEAIHSYPNYLSLWKTGFCWFSKEKNTKFFYITTYFRSQTSAYFRYFSFLQADGFLRNWSSIPSHFHANNCNFALFFNFLSNNSRTRLQNKWFSGSRNLTQVRKEKRVG